MRFASFLAIAASATFFSCSGKVDPDSNAAASSVVVPPATGSGAPIPSAVVQSTLQSCTTPEGPVHAWTTGTEVAQLLQGRWLQCPSDTASMGVMTGGLNPNSDVGVEFDGGQFYALGLDANGNAVRGQGFAKTGNVHYDESPPYTYLYFNTNSANLFQPSFEDSPRKMLALIPEIGNVLYVGVP